MAILLGTNSLNKRTLGINVLNKIMLGITQVFPGLIGGVNPPPWNPSDMFKNGEQGAWYDFYDDMDTKLQWCIDNPAYTNASFLAQFPNHTLFQDSAGTTAVTGVEQSLGLVLDKSKGLALGAETIINGGFNTATDWTLGAGASISGGRLEFVASNALTYPSAYTTNVGKWYKLTFDMTSVTAGSLQLRVGGGGNFGYFSNVGSYSAYAYTTNTDYFQIVSNTFTGSIDNISVKEIPGNHRTQATTGFKPKWSARKNWLLATATMSTQNVTTVATPYTISHTGTGTITLSGTSTAGPLVGAGSLTFTPTAGTLTMTVSGTVSNAQLEYGSTATAYQRVNTATDYNAIGFPKGCKYDGVDDFMSVPIDFSATDKISVSMGVQKQSDAAAGVLLEHTIAYNTQNGSFFLAAPESANFSYSTASRFNTGASATHASTTAAGEYPAPHKGVLTTLHDISGDSTILRVNAVAEAAGVGDKGTGNFANDTLYFGRRGGTSLPFNGVEFNTTIIGRPFTAPELTNIETFNAEKTGAVLP